MQLFTGFGAEMFVHSTFDLLNKSTLQLASEGPGPLYVGAIIRKNFRHALASIVFPSHLSESLVQRPSTLLSSLLSTVLAAGSTSGSFSGISGGGGSYSYTASSRNDPVRNASSRQSSASRDTPSVTLVSRSDRCLSFVHRLDLMQSLLADPLCSSASPDYDQTTTAHQQAQTPAQSQAQAQAQADVSPFCELMVRAVLYVLEALGGAVDKDRGSWRLHGSLRQGTHTSYTHIRRSAYLMMPLIRELVIIILASTFRTQFYLKDFYIFFTNQLIITELNNSLSIHSSKPSSH